MSDLTDKLDSIFQLYRDNKICYAEVLNFILYLGGQFGYDEVVQVINSEVRDRLEEHVNSLIKIEDDDSSERRKRLEGWIEYFAEM